MKRYYDTNPCDLFHSHGNVFRSQYRQKIVTIQFVFDSKCYMPDNYCIFFLHYSNKCEIKCDCLPA